jgi:K+-sensing histidine kinase KdpD
MESDVGGTSPAVPPPRSPPDPSSCPAADLSHDLKTPLTSIKMSIYLLMEDAAHFSPAQRELLTAAAEDVERLQALIAEHLDKPRA